ncbi:MAG: signal peptidase II [Polyangiales bacterium]
MKSQSRSRRALAFCIVGVVALTAADLWTKSWAESRLSSAQGSETSAPCMADAQGHYYMQRLRSDSIMLVDGFLELRYAENCGAAFGLLDQSPRWLRAAVFMTAGVLAIIALLWMFSHGSGGVLFAWSVPLVVSGAVGNMVDRLRLGYVVDFIHFHIHDSFEWPTFNFADSTITVGVALLLLDGMRRQAPHGQSPAPASRAEKA